MFVYGRDEMESLYICPRKLLYQTSFKAMILKTIAKTADSLSFITTVIRETPLTPGEFPAVIKELYHKLDKSIIIGKNQTLFLDQLPAEDTGNRFEENHFENLEYLIQQKECQKFKKESQILLKKWEAENRSQLWIESKIKYIFCIMQKFDCMHETQESIDYMLDDAFSYAATMDNLSESIMGIINQSISEKIRGQNYDKADIYREITEYLNRNISDELSIQVICRKFGLSQTSLSKLFRTYADYSFNNYLTNIRIEKAKRIIQEDRDIFVKDIASRVGYSDQFYFSRIFHSVTGVCPSDYIEQLRGY
jgi:YesN/AraC family two-component response regulator